MRRKTSITPEIVSKVVGLLNKGYTQSQIKKEIPISTGTVSAIKTERQRILDEAKNGNIVKADLSKINFTNSQTKVAWEKRKKLYSKEIKEALNLQNKEEAKVISMNTDIKKEEKINLSKININYKGIKINITDDIKNISFGDNQITIE